MLYERGMERYGVAIIGGGILGLATAVDILERRPGLRLVVLEKEAELALHQSGRNSGVVHSGIYYRPGSLKARLCREGTDLLERFAVEHGVPYRVCGKLVVAVEKGELGRLRTLSERALANGVPDVREIGPEELREIEPHVTGIRALHSPTTAITDFRRIALALGDEVRARGGTILLRSAVRSIRSQGPRHLLKTARGTLEVSGLISCAGLQSDRVAAMSTGDRAQRIVPFRGSYQRFTEDARGLVRHLVYPVPDPDLPFLGVHFTPRLDGEVWVGPSAVLALAREGTRPWQVRPGDLGATLGFAGFWRLAGRHWRTGAGEIRRDLSKRAFLRECRRYLPELRREQLLPGPFGVRAQAVNKDGTLEDDFSLLEGEGMIHVRNAPSPGGTASLAIGKLLADRMIARLDAD
ncbi:MAG TPA: L-2-hydroxyglutarate oxidase [Gemmatimonadota bacterium]|nr:L-2-hydroxyglutarate oxidase [Gemmatimonadota bacterium]